MDLSPDDAAKRRASLSEILKALRRHRGLRTVEVAAAMGMPIRSYEHFESGAGRLNRERVHQFAEAIDVDPFGIFAAIAIGSPDFAIRCADNKLMTILLMALSDFDISAGDEIPRLEASTLIAIFTRAFEELKAQAQARDEFVEQWMASKPLSHDDESTL
jgi:transcriptional regulator with XRE-family HTH domain